MMAPMSGPETYQGQGCRIKSIVDKVCAKVNKSKKLLCNF